MKIFWTLLFLTVFLVQGLSEASTLQSVTTTNQAVEQVIKVSLVSPIQVGETKDVEAVFDGLTPQAVQLGFNETTLLGRAEYQKLANKQTRVKIIWHSLSMRVSMTGTIAEPLTPVLLSQFTTGDKLVEPNTILSARGNLEAVTKTFLVLKEKSATDKTPRHLVTKAEDEEEEERDNKADEYTPTASGGALGGGSAPFNQDSTEYNADLITTSWEDCAVRVAASESRVYTQHRPIDTNEAGEVVDSGSCVDTGTFVDAVKEYGGNCDDVTDFPGQKVYEQYREYATVDGTEVAVRACTVDFNKTYTIQSNTSSCGYKHDFTLNKSIEQEILYYTKGADVIDLTPCQDSNRAFDHFETELTCDWLVDEVNSLAFKQTRIAFTDGAGGTDYASDCAPLEGDTGKPIEEAYCTDKYEHDFINNVSYYRVKKYYLDDVSQPVYVTACARSTSLSFPHIQTTDTCAVVNDDANLKTQFFALKQIDTPEDGIIEIAPCAEYGPPVAYVRSSDKTNVWEKTSSSSLTLPGVLASNTIVVDLCGAGGGGGGGVRASVDWGYTSGAGGAGGYCFKAYTYTASPGQSFSVTIGVGGNGGAIGYASNVGHSEATAGSNGGTSKFDTILTAAGGKGGGAGDIKTAVGGAGGGGGAGAGGNSNDGAEYAHVNGSNGGATIYFSGGTGGAKTNRWSGYSGGGGGGASFFAKGGNGGYAGTYTSVSAGSAGAGTKGSGGGGGGGTFVQATSRPGGKGGSGYCRVTYYTPQYVRGDNTTYAP